MSDFKALIQNWYAKNKRNLPWRNENNPYFTWLSEVILQQTRVSQGLAYYLKFTTKYPTIFDLDAASEQEVLHLWQGLGYYSRARNLKKAANQIVTDYNGKFPTTKKELLKLKGIGTYTASAISSIAYNEPHAVLDGNVYRVLSRIYAENTPIDTTDGKKHFENLAENLLDKKNPGNYNQAIMELGALICKPKKPDCEECPVLELCESGRNQTWNQFPVKSKKIKIKNRVLHYAIIHDNNSVLIQQRTEKDIWQNLNEFPLIESEGNINVKSWSSFLQISENNIVTIEKQEQIKHKLTHQHLTINFYEIKLKVLPEGINKIKITDIKSKPFPIVLKNKIESTNLFL